MCDSKMFLVYHLFSENTFCNGLIWVAKKKVKEKKYWWRKEKMKK